jgi:drug/metabolite transporter (DMT)-like permease
LKEEYKKGIIYAILGNIFVSFQPIIANSRPLILDAHLFAAMTVLIEALVFLPIMIIELKVKNDKNNKENNSKILIPLLKKWKKYFLFFIFVGLIFGLNQLLYFVGYQLSGAIIGSLTQKTTVFFSIIFGFFILKEQINKMQIIFSILLFLGLAIAITNGSIFFIFTLSLENLLGVLIILFISALWMFGHTITKPFFTRKEVEATEMVFMRNIISFILLFPTYFLFYPLENLTLLLDPINQFYYLAMGVVYASGLYCWYKSLSLLDVSKATILFSFTPIGTAIFASFILGELFTVFHLIGTIIVILSIYFIMKLKS